MLTEAIAQYDCTVREEFDAGDHVIVLLQLHDVVVHSRGQPLIFHRSGFRRLAPA
jgi:flavin reductase (DIM6/NTAB) family NADH-FMN oxidoreductase RutF